MTEQSTPRAPAPEAASQAAVATVWRAECGKIVGALARLTRDVGLAEECAQDALVAALEHWPQRGVPDNPGAWLMTTAKRRALDHLRHHQVMAREHDALGADLDALQAGVVPDFVDDLDRARQDVLGDDQLRLMFIACHPVLSMDARVALTLRLLGGLTTEEIASAFLQPEPTIAQRIVRAKKSLSAAAVPFDLPGRDALTERLEAVLEVLYLVFNEGYSASHGAHWMRPALCEEAIRLARVLAERLPSEGEVHGLLALMLLQASRGAARLDAQGQPVLLLDQDRTRWDAAMIEAGLAALQRAQALAAQAQQGWRPYALQAAIAACHAVATEASATDWHRIAALYDTLVQIAPSPVVALNRAMAVAMAFGPAAGLAQMDRLQDEPRLQRYHWLPAARADLLLRLGRRAEAQAEFERAAALTANERERALLLERAAEAAGGA